MTKKAAVFFILVLIFNEVYSLHKDTGILKIKTRIEKNDTIIEKKSNLKINLLPFVGLYYERDISKKIVFQIGFNYEPGKNYDIRTYDFKIIPEIRFYLGKNIQFPIGFYLSNYAYYKEYTIVKKVETDLGQELSKSKVIAIGDGIKTGYQFTFKNNLTIDCFLGLGYNIYRNISILEGKKSLNKKDLNMDVTYGLTFGYLF